MVCVVEMRRRQQGAGQSVCSRSIHRMGAKGWTERMRKDGEKANDGEQESRSQKTEQIQG